MKVFLLHGWQSTPGGVKPTYLKNHGHEVLNPALPVWTAHNEAIGQVRQDGSE